MMRYLTPSLMLLVCLGCDKGGMTDVEIHVYNGFLQPAHPIWVAPDLCVGKNEFVSWDGGFRGRQRLTINDNAALILVPQTLCTSEPPEKFVYISRQSKVTTAIEVHCKNGAYRRIDLDNASTSLTDDALRKQLRRAPWNRIGYLQSQSLQTLLLAWAYSKACYAAPDGAEDRLILPNGVTCGIMKDATPPAEWNVLIHALREFCPPCDKANQQWLIKRDVPNASRWNNKRQSIGQT